MEYMVISVDENDTAATVARKFKATERSLFVLNEPRFYAGERLIVEVNRGKNYTVMPFDTAQTIAKRFNVSENKLIKLNGTDKFFLGQTVIIPDDKD